MVHRLAILPVGIVLILTACASSPDPPSTDGEETVAWARSMLDRGKNSAAVDELEKLVLNYPDKDFSDEAQFLLGKAHMAMKEYILAENAFRMLLSSYPGSRYREEAELGIALCYVRQAPKYQLDQTATLSGVRSLEMFIEDHPGSALIPDALSELRECKDRLARKILDAGRFYLKRGRLNSARVYFDQVREEYPDTRSALMSRFFAAKCYEKEGDSAKAALGYSTLLGEIGDDDQLREELVESLSSVREELDGDG